MKEKIRAGLSQVKMCGETAQEAILTARERCGGEFKNFNQFIDTIDRRKVNVRVVKMLVYSSAFDNLLGEEKAKLWKMHFDELYPLLGTKKLEAVLDEKRKSIEQDWEMKLDEVLNEQAEALNFKTSNDIFGEYRRLCKLIMETVPVQKIKDIDNSKKDMKLRNIIAQATSIKFGYKERAKAAGEKKNVGTADALGGIYGNLDDGTTFTMGIYSPKLYKKRRETIQNIKGEVAVFQANVPFARKQNVMIEDFRLLSQIAKGRPGKIELPIVGGIDKDGFEEREWKKKVKACTLCPLHKGCHAPVPPSIGRLNLMVLGEAPGEQEDREGRGFIGKSGRLLFDELEKVGIRRNDCIVANTVACRPPNNKLPNITYVTKCPWATEAIKRFRPKFILASGNSALYYFRKINKGITEWSGKTEWNNRAEAWVTYCLHPASALYDRAANLPVLQKALTEFATVVRNFL
jgi:DNA polymerase